MKITELEVDEDRVVWGEDPHLGMVELVDENGCVVYCPIGPLPVLNKPFYPEEKKFTYHVSVVGTYLHGAIISDEPLSIKDV